MSVVLSAFQSAGARRTALPAATRVTRGGPACELLRAVLPELEVEGLSFLPARDLDGLELAVCLDSQVGLGDTCVADPNAAPVASGVVRAQLVDVEGALISVCVDLEGLRIASEALDAEPVTCRRSGCRFHFEQVPRLCVEKPVARAADGDRQRRAFRWTLDEEDLAGRLTAFRGPEPGPAATPSRRRSSSVSISLTSRCTRLLR